MKKWKGALAGECVPCLQGACQRWWELNLREGASEPMGGGWTIGERVTPADFILRRIMALPRLTANCLRGYLCLCLQTSTELQTSTVKQSVWYPAAPRLAFIMLQSSASVLLPKGALTEDGYLSITVPRPHPLSSSESCISLLISSTCQKLGEHLLGQTATLLNKDTVVINNQPFSSSLFGLARPCIRPSTCFLAASLRQASTSFGP